MIKEKAKDTLNASLLMNELKQANKQMKNVVKSIEDGSILGVFTTRFNWSFIYEIIDSVKLNNDSELFVINNQGVIIGSRDRKGIMQRNLSSIHAVRKLMAGESYGYTIENELGKRKIFAYCRTKGYNAYEGKEWSVIVSEPID